MEIFLLVILIGLLPAAIARGKGRGFFEWWIYGSLLFIVALPHAILAKPDRQELDRREMREGASRKCPYCAEIIRREAVVCRYCGKDLAAAAGGLEPERRDAGGMKACSHCAKYIRREAKVCSYCGKDLAPGSESALA